METKDVGGRQEILTKWKELLSKQPEALIHSNRAPLPVSPYVCFCLSEQQSIKEKLCRENPNITLTQVSRHIADKWASLRPEEKAPYEEMAAARARRGTNNSTERNTTDTETAALEISAANRKRGLLPEYRLREEVKRVSVDSTSIATPQEVASGCSSSGRTTDDCIKTNEKSKKPRLQPQLQDLDNVTPSRSPSKEKRFHKLLDDN